MRIIDGNFNRINMSPDCTGFLLNIHCERQGGRTYFEGLFCNNVANDALIVWDKQNGIKHSEEAAD
jgi:hypothetical protein